MARVWKLTMLIVLFACAASAQVQSGVIAGTVIDEQGAVLPGATVQLKSEDRTAEFATGPDGRYRFLALPPGYYSITATLSGFTTVVRDRVEVRIGQTVDLPLTMRVAALQESVTVVGESPIIDARHMGTATNFTQDELARVPNSRDPWALLRTVPGVILDRVNVAGNETGQQSGYAAKGLPGTQSTWTLDGVVITDMSATGASPTYFDYDAFDEIQISTSGQDIRQPTGGVGLNFVVKRGTNQWRGGVKGFFTGEGLEGSNVPGELKTASAGGLPAVTPRTADHNKQISEYGFDLGGRLIKDRAWVWGSVVKQDIRLVRASGNLIDRTLLDTFNVKGNWQATSKDMISVLWFLGAKKKYGRSPGYQSFEAPTATWNQGNFYPEGAPHGLLKFQDDRVISSSLFLSAKYAYYGTGFSLDPVGGLAQQAGQSAVQARTFGSTIGQYFLRPQHNATADATWFSSGSSTSHEVKMGVSWRRTDAFARLIWPGDKVVAFHDNNTSPDGRYVRLYREGAGTDRTAYFSLYASDTIARNRLTLDLGLRYDRQGGRSLPSRTEANGAFANIVPGIDFAGYEAPFTWNNLSPRVGLTLGLDEAKRTLLRASFARFAGQLANGVVGWSNPSTTPGFAQYRWVDTNGDNVAQPAEVLLQNFITAGGGFNPSAPTAVTSPNRIDPDLQAPVTDHLVVGIDRELAANLALKVNYTFSHTGNYTYNPFIGMTAADHPQTGTIAGSLPDGRAFSVPIYTPDFSKAAAVGFGLLLTNYEGYTSSYQGVEVTLLKRLSHKWMMRVSGSWNDAIETFDMNPAVNVFGNPTRRDTEPLVSGGQFAPRTAGSGAGDVFVNAKWQVNLNGVYQLPGNMQVAGNLFGKQGTPFPLQRTVSLGALGSNRVLVTPELDTLRLDDTWSLDLRWTKAASFAARAHAEVFVDVFNALNANPAINRVRNLASPNFNRITQNLSPRILRIGVRVGF